MSFFNNDTSLHELLSGLLKLYGKLVNLAVVKNRLEYKQEKVNR